MPDEVEFATKPTLPREMIARALDAGTHACCVAGDEVYGADPALCKELEDREVGYMLAIGSDRRVRTEAGLRRPDAIATSLPRRVW